MKTVVNINVLYLAVRNIVAMSLMLMHRKKVNKRNKKNNK